MALILLALACSAALFPGSEFRPRFLLWHDRLCYCIGVTTGAAAGARFIAHVRGDERRPAPLSQRSGNTGFFRKFLFIALPLMLGRTVVMLDEQFLRKRFSAV